MSSPDLAQISPRSRPDLVASRSDLAPSRTAVCRLAPLPLILALGVGAVLLSILISHGLGDLLIPVVVYALVISAMLWRALARLGGDVPKRSALLAAAGAASFVFSDTLIGINRFVVAFEAAPYLLITTYWLGQWGITASAFHQTTRASEGQLG